MNKFNLTFWGEILPGHDPATVKARFAKMFDIRDAERLEHFFSGETITLRRNIERKVAAEYFAKLHKLGVEAELIKLDATGNPPASRKAEPQPEPEPEGDDKRSQWEHARRQAELEVIQRARLDAEARKREEQERLRQEQQRVEEERQFRERQAQLESEKQEALARREAEKERARLEREAEAARLRAEQEERRRQQAEEEERQRLQREEERQRKAEEAARKKAEAAAEAELRRAEEVAKRQEELERQQRLREEEARRKEAEEAERLRLRAEREEQLRTEREEKQRLKAEAAERRKAEARAAAEERRRDQEHRRREREEALAKKRAEREAARKAAEAEAARRREEQAELDRQRAEQAAQEQARREAERREKAAAAAARKAALAAAREAAEQELARKKAKAQERKRLRQEAAKREAAVRAQEKQQAADHQAREREQAEQLRREQDQARKQQLAAEKAQREAEAAREREKVLARQREEDARRRAEREAQAHKRQVEKETRARERAAAKAQQEALKQEELEREQVRAQERKRMEEQAIARGAAGLAKQQNLKRSPTTVKSGLELPRREKPGQGPARKKQAGAPNDYQTRPFRNTSEIRNRPALAAQKLRKGLGLAALVLAVALLLVGRYLATPPVVVYSGPGDIAAAAGGQLLIHIGDKLLLHDRAGIGKATVEVGQLQLRAATGPLAFAGDGQLLLRASSLDDNTPRLRRCDLAALNCEPLADIALAADSALAVHSLTGQLFLADPEAGKVSKYESDGRRAAAAELPLAPRPALALDSGLLFMNSHEGPAVSVRRYEDQAFGQQLDEVLLLPPAALDAGQVQVFDFLPSGDRWWVSMINPDTGSAGLYLFDSQWKYLSDVALPDSHLPARLVPWGQKVLVTRPTTSRILRFDGSGTPEADLESNLLSELIQSQERHKSWVAIGWAAAFSLCLVVVAVTLSFTYIQYLRNLVYRGRTTRGAEPLDQFSDDLQWAAPEQAREARLRRTTLTYGLLCLATVLLLVGLGADIHLLLAALVAMAGPAAGLYLYGRGGTGHAGASGETLALVDHRDVYHLAEGARIQYRGPFLLIDDVVVFTGTALLPALAPGQVKQVLQPVAAAGARVDRKTVLVKLLEVRHPLALAALVCALCTLGAAVALLTGAF